MNYTYKFVPIALTEYKEAIEWYNERSTGAAENFVADVSKRIEDICTDPFRFRNTYKYFREVSLKKYPFYIVYFIDSAAKVVVISSLYHHKRNPNKKFRKA